jgi:hypothetical protein
MTLPLLLFCQERGIEAFGRPKNTVWDELENPCSRGLLAQTLLQIDTHEYLAMLLQALPNTKGMNSNDTNGIEVGSNEGNWQSDDVSRVNRPFKFQSCSLSR